MDELVKAVAEQPKDVAVAMVEKTAVDDRLAMDLVKFLHNPNMVKNAGRKSEFRRAKAHFSEFGDAGVEWAFRYAAFKAAEREPFARRSSESASVDKIAAGEQIEKGESGNVWGESPFSVGGR